jgi:hypothetical protein
MKPKRPIESTATNAEILSQEDQYFTADSTEKLFLQPLECYGNLNNCLMTFT